MNDRIPKKKNNISERVKETKEERVNRKKKSKKNKKRQKKHKKCKKNEIFTTSSTWRFLNQSGFKTI